MGLGIYALVDSDSLKDFIHIIDSDLDVNLFGLAGGLIVGVSLIIAAIAFFGCCGAVKVREIFPDSFYTFLGSAHGRFHVQ